MRYRSSGNQRTTRVAAVAGLAVALVSLPTGASGQPQQAQATCHNGARSAYLLGPDDEVEIAGPELDEHAVTTMRIDGDGEVQVPLVGRVPVANLTVQEAQQELNRRFSIYIRNPQITINVKELRSQPVSILGAVNAPGIHQVRGNNTLLEMLSLAGGLRPDAGNRIRVTRQRGRGCLPLPDATLDPSGQFAVAEVSVKEITGQFPQGNIQILPHDVISVPRAEMVYVIGDVKRSGGFVIGDNESMSILQVLSLAEGMNGTADRRHARILRPTAGGTQRTEMIVDVKAILDGKSEDVAMRADDILFIPGSTGKKVSLRALETAIQTGTGVLTGLFIWR
jgi:polysaccharide export outer membrane protein